MSSLFNHIFIPLAILLLFSKRLNLDTRKVIALVFFAILPDADTILLPHRAALHSIFILFVPALLFVLIRSRRDIFGIVCFYLASHLVLDLFNGGIFLLYPVYNNVFFANVELMLDHNKFMPLLDYGIRSDILNTGRGEPVISSENIGVTLILIVFSLISVLRSKPEKSI